MVRNISQIAKLILFLNFKISRMMARFTFGDYLRLRWKAFFRSPNFYRKLPVRLVLLLFYLFFIMETVLMSVGAFYMLQQSFPLEDSFLVLNRYIYMFFIISFFMIVGTSGFKAREMKPFALLPVERTRLIHYYLTGSLLRPVTMVLFLWVVLVVLTYGFHGYHPVGLLLWALAVMSVLWIFSVFAWLTEKSVLFNMLGSLTLLGLMATAHKLPHYLRPLAEFFYRIYRGNFFYLLLMIVPAVVFYVAVVKYLRRNFYLDGKLREKKSGGKLTGNFSWMERFGAIGAFIRNDIKMILRNERAKTLLYQSFFSLLFAAFVFYSPIYAKNSFMHVLMAMLMTGVFLVNYGSFVPAWDSEYFKLLVSQSINYEQYLESKWWLMVLSVVVLAVASIPFVFFGPDIYRMILIFAVFNAGISVYWVLLIGLFNTTPLKLNEKIKAFSGSQSFNGKMFLLGFVRIGFSVGLFYILRYFLGHETALKIFLVLGLAGFFLKKPVLHSLARLYNRRKYIFVETFSKQDES
jgi:hypothetical protein